ncbi:TPA: hypothetical protein QDA78_003695 [Burkholderia vietnamiensis]|nr:hypothetical protein [Burkholderia vietnamiensis]
MKIERIVEIAEQSGFERTWQCCVGVPNKFCPGDSWRGNLSILAAAIEREVLAAHQDQPEPRAEVTDDDKLCASRYRWLSRQVVATHSRDDLNCRWEVDYVLYGESFDAAIDAARTGASS